MPEFRTEAIETVKDDIMAMLYDYEQELPLPFQLRPDWEQYKLLEGLGTLHILTVRDNTELLGYFVMLFTPNLNEAGELVAFGATLYLKKEHRKGLLGIRLIKKGEEIAKARGAKCIMISSQIIKPIDKLLELKEYKPTEKIYAKRI